MVESILEENVGTNCIWCGVGNLESRIDSELTIIVQMVKLESVAARTSQARFCRSLGETFELPQEQLFSRASFPALPSLQSSRGGGGSVFLNLLGHSLIHLTPPPPSFCSKRLRCTITQFIVHTDLSTKRLMSRKYSRLLSYSPPGHQKVSMPRWVVLTLSEMVLSC